MTEESSHTESSGTEALVPGTLLDGRFRVDGALGRGGFATIYRGLQLNIERPVAIKVLDASAKGARAKEVARRFLQEAKIAAQIDHPSIVNIIDFGVIPDTEQPYIVMELLVGRDLGAELKLNGPFAPSRIVPLLIDALEGLAAGHRAGVVHKDLKPSNLFLSHAGEENERLCVLDFGVARLKEEEAGAQKMTQTGHFLGTPQYLAPEYVNDQCVTPAIDVYQMGLILVEVLTGTALIEAETTMKCIVKSSLGAFSIPDPILTSPLGGVVSKALAFEHAERFEDGWAFAQALRSIDLVAADAVDVCSVPPPTTKQEAQKLAPSDFISSTSQSEAYEVDATAMTLGYEADSAVLRAADPANEVGDRRLSLPFDVKTDGPLDARSDVVVRVDSGDVAWVASQRRKGLLYLLVAVMVAALALWALAGGLGEDEVVPEVTAPSVPQPTVTPVPVQATPVEQPVPMSDAAAPLAPDAGSSPPADAANVAAPTKKRAQGVARPSKKKKRSSASKAGKRSKTGQKRLPQKAPKAASPKAPSGFILK